MAVILANNANGKLAASITAAATTIALQTGQGDRFPSPAPGDWFPLTMVRDTGEVEICKCTDRTGDILTVVRSQEGTIAKTLDPGARVSLRITNAVFSEIFGVTHNVAVMALAALTPVADRLMYFTDDETAGLAVLTEFARSILDDSDAGTMRATLGLGSASLRTALGANELYSRDSIVGPVAQLAGVPTGSIIEYGSNANGSYLKFADGTMICSKIHSFPANSNNNAGTVISYPATFASVTTVLGSSSTIASASAGSSIVVEAQPNTATSMKAKALQHSAATVSDLTFEVAASLVAIGRWY